MDKKDREAILSTLSGLIAQGKGKIAKENALGVRELAYPIDKQNKAEYYLVEFEAEAEILKNLDQKLRLSESVIRHLLVKKGKSVN